jgi:hypothetical protein
MNLFAIERNQGTAVYAQIARILETEFIKNGMNAWRSIAI